MSELKFCSLDRRKEVQNLQLKCLLPLVKLHTTVISFASPPSSRFQRLESASSWMEIEKHIIYKTSKEKLKSRGGDVVQIESGFENLIESLC